MTATSTDRFLDAIDVAAPCPASWDAMTGDDRVRHCAECKLNVYNLSAMTEEQATELVREKEGRLCVRFYRRADGTMLTADCPTGLAALKRRARLAWARVAAVLALLSAGLLSCIGRESKPTDETPQGGITQGDILQGEAMVRPDPEAIMGKICPPKVEPIEKPIERN